MRPVLNWIKEGEGQGNGPTVVLSHALGCSLRMWDDVVALLTADFTVLRYDHRGHGRSEAPPGPYSLQALADDIAALIQNEANGPVHFVGLSMGGMTAQALAASHPELLQTVVIANSAQHYDAAARAMWQTRVETVRAHGVGAVADGAMQRWFSPGYRANAAGMQRIAELRSTLEQTDVAAYAASCEAVAAIDFRASNLKIARPVLVIAGTLDEATPPAMSADIALAITGAQLRKLDAAHLSAVEQPAAFTRLLKSFWASV